MKIWLAALPFVIWILTALVGRWIYRGKPKTDKGFMFCYWGLSPRRRFLRTLWCLPLFVVCLVIIQVSGKSYLLTGIVGAVCGGIGAVQAVYNYRKWKAEEADRPERES